MSTQTWLQSLIKLYTRANKPGAPARPAPAPAATNFARPVYGPAPRPTYGPPTQAQARAQGYMPDLPFALPRFEADPASRAPVPAAPRIGPPTRAEAGTPPLYTAKVYAPGNRPGVRRNPLANLPAVPAPIASAFETVGGWQQGYAPIAEKWAGERAEAAKRIYGLPYDAGRPELKTVNPLVKKLITTVLPSGENLVTAYEDVIQLPQRLEQAERNPTIGNLVRDLHYGLNVAGSYLGQFGQALAGTPLGTLEGEATRDPAYRQQLARSPAGRLLSPAARQQAMAPFLGLSMLMAQATGHEEIIPTLAGLQDPIVPTTSSLQESVAEALPTYLNRYSPAEQFAAEIGAGWYADPLTFLGMGAKASKAARLRRNMATFFPGMQDMVGSLSLLDRFTMATAKGINEGKVPLVGWVMRETPKTQVYARAQDAMTYGGYLTQMLPPNPSADDVVRVFNDFLSRPDDVTGGAARARALAKTLGDEFDIAATRTVQEAIENGTPVNMAKLNGELADTAFLREAEKTGSLVKDKKTGDLVFAEPWDQRMVRWLKDIESAFLLGTPAYPIRNMANNVFTAAFDGYGVGRGLDDAKRLAAEVPISNPGVYQDITGVPVSGANTFTEYLQGKGWRLSEKMPWSRAARHVASDSVIGERQAKLRVFGDAVGKLKDDLYINGPDLGRGATGLRPVIAPDIAGPHAGLVNQVLARDWNVEKARKEIAQVLKGGTRPPIDTLLPQRLYLRPEMVDALNVAWKNARTKDDFLKVLDKADNIIRQQISDAAASGAHADITQVGDALAPVADQMAATIVPGVPETRQIAEQVAQVEQGRVDNVLQTVAQQLGQSAEPTQVERATNGVLAIMTRLEYQWQSSYIEANRLLNRYNKVRQNIFERGLKGEDKTRALQTAWNNYEKAITQHWTSHHAQADRLVQDLLGQYGDLVSGKLPAGSLDQRAAERAIEHLRRNTPELFADDAFKAKVEGNRKQLGFERVAVVQRVMSYVAKTGDTKPVSWLADAIAEERRLTDVAVGEISGMRSTMRKDPGWADVAGEAWDSLNIDQRSVWRAFLAALDDSAKTGKLVAPKFNEYTQLFRLVEANDRVNALNKLAKGAGIATDNGQAVPNYNHLANFLNKAFREAGLTDDVMFQAPATGITRAWREYVMGLDEGQLAVALRALNGREALTPLERMIGQTKSIAAKQYIRQYTDWLQGDQTLPPPTRGKLTEVQAKAWRKKVDDLLGGPEVPPATAPAPSIAQAPPTTVGVSPASETPPVIAPALQAARDTNVQLAEQIGVKDEILARAAEGQDVGTIARDLRAEGALPESYDFTPGEPAAMMEPLTSTDRAVVKSVIDAEPVAPAAPPAPVAAAVEPERISGTRAVAQRIANAESDFIDNVITQFGFTRDEANQILTRYIKEKAVKLDPNIGRYQITDGRFWDKEVMSRALPAVEAAPPVPAARVEGEIVSPALWKFPRQDYIVSRIKDYAAKLEAQGDRKGAARVRKANWKYSAEGATKIEEWVKVQKDSLRAALDRGEDVPTSILDQFPDVEATPKIKHEYGRGDIVEYQGKPHEVVHSGAFAVDIALPGQDPIRVLPQQLKLLGKQEGLDLSATIAPELLAVAQPVNIVDDVARMPMADIERQYPTMAASMKIAAHDMIDALRSGEPGRRIFIDAGPAGTEVRGLSSSYPPWYGQLIAEQGVSKKTVINALTKIREGKYDKGKTVERLKKVIIEQMADGYEMPAYKLQPDVEAWSVMGRAAEDLQTPEAQIARQAEKLGFDLNKLEGDDEFFYLQRGGEDGDYFAGPLNIIREYLDSLTKPGIAAPGTAETQNLLAKLFGKPRPSATHVARNEAEGQLWELGQLRQNADRMWNTSVMPASPETARATMQWFDQTAVPRIAVAKTMVGNLAQAAMNEIMLDYGRTRNIDRILDLAFPYHYWTTRSGWNWAKRTMHHPATIGTYLKTRQDRIEERKSDNGLRPRFWNSMKVQFPWLPDWMEDELWFNFENLIIPFSDFTLPDWDNVEEANSAWYKAYLVAEGLNLMPHVPMKALALHSEGLGWGGARDYIPQWNVAAAMAGPSPTTWGPGPGGAAFHAYLTNRMLGSMAADALHLPNVDYNDPKAVLEAAQRAGMGDMTPLMPYLEASAKIEAWKKGELSEEEVKALFDDPLIGEAIKRAAFEKALPTVSGFMTGLPVRGRATGESLQVQLQNAKSAMSYGGEVAGEEGLRENAQTIGGAFPWERVRWAQYGALPGEQDFNAEDVYWMTYEDAGMQDIEQRFDSLEEALIQQNPGDHELFLAYQTERFAAIDGLEQTLPKDEQKPYLWSIVGASPTEAAQIRQNQIVYRLYSTRPKPNDYLLANGKPDWDKWNKAVETWNQSLLTTAQADPIITEALAHFSANEREMVLGKLATTKNMEAYGRSFDDPLTALHKTVWDIYYQPVRDYMAAAEKQYGKDIFERQAAYRAELIERFGENIYDVQDGYYKLKEGSQARRNYVKANPQLKAYWDNKDAIARKHRVLAFIENKDKLWAKIPRVFKGGQATAFIDAVMKAYPEKKWTREELLKVYATVKPFPDRFYMQALNDFEEERLQAFYLAAGISPNRAREGAWTPEEIKAAVFAGQALPLDTIPEQLAEGMGTPETPAIQKAADELLAAEERAKASGGKGKSSGGRSSGRRSYSRRYYSRGGGGGGGGGSAPVYRPYLPGYTPGATKERRRVYIR